MAVKTMILAKPNRSQGKGEGMNISTLWMAIDIATSVETVAFRLIFPTTYFLEGTGCSLNWTPQFQEPQSPSGAHKTNHRLTASTASFPSPVIRTTTLLGRQIKVSRALRMEPDLTQSL